MILQQETKIPVWGTGEAGEAVTVAVGDHTASTTVGGDGKWRVDLDPFPDGTAPLAVTVIGKNSIRFEDVLVGDVWLCSGQSNMRYHLHDVENAATELPKANDAQMRLFLVAEKTSFDPVSDVSGKWVVCTPETADSFSGVAYFFARDLRAARNRPIGLIGTYYGGSTAQAWIPLPALKNDPALTSYIGIYDKFRAAHQAEGDNPPPPPPPGQPAPKPADGGQRAPTVLYNAMLQPIIPYAIKGVIWYQGEDNGWQGSAYRPLFYRLIASWREMWGEGDFPFLFVQLPNCHVDQGENNWPLLREAQLQTLAVPNTGMAVTIDVGDAKNLHPKDKMDVGSRLALIARHVAYHENLVYSGPIYASMTAEGSAIRLSFTQIGSGLCMGSAASILRNQTPADTLIGFSVAGPDKKWVPADARIDGETVVVSSPQVPSPSNVRYAWDPAPQCNLYNKEGLPASPFRTDHD